jgi:lipopolysaccharide transport system permease protein
MMVWFKATPTVWVVILPLLMAIMTVAAAGTGMWLTALSVQFRDVRFAMGFAIQLLLYCSPVIYPVSVVPDRFRLVYGLNPMTGVIEGFRAALLDTGPVPWDLLAVGAATATAIAVTGVLFFRRMERIFADVV